MSHENLSENTLSEVNIKGTIIRLLSNLANPKEFNQYMTRFVEAGQARFAVIKVGGAILDNDLENLCSSLVFLERIGLFPIIIHGAGPQLSRNLFQAKIESSFIDGQRITSKAVLKIARRTFAEQNMKLSNRLQAMGIKTSSITSGVFTAKQTNQIELGYVGDVTDVELQAINLSIDAGAIPILSPLAESESGQILNINADMATNQLAISLNPYKIIFLTTSGGLLDQNGEIISSINLLTDYGPLMEQPWLHSGMKLKIQQIAKILSQLPSTSSVSITKPAHLAKELFTHKGSGTLIRKGESIMCHRDLESIKLCKLKKLIKTSFGKLLCEDYFEITKIHCAYITYCYRAAAIITLINDIPYLDKFVVADDAKGEGLGKALWKKLKSNNPRLHWRSRHGNKINEFYFKNSDGCIKTKSWIIFWYGIVKFEEINQCVLQVSEKKTTLLDSDNEEKLNE